MTLDKDYAQQAECIAELEAKLADALEFMQDASTQNARLQAQVTALSEVVEDAIYVFDNPGRHSPTQRDNMVADLKDALSDPAIIEVAEELARLRESRKMPNGLDAPDNMGTFFGNPCSVGCQVCQNDALRQTITQQAKRITELEAKLPDARQKLHDGNDVPHVHVWQSDGITQDVWLRGVRLRECSCGVKQWSDPFTGEWQAL